MKHKFLSLMETEESEYAFNSFYDQQAETNDHEREILKKLVFNAVKRDDFLTDRQKQCLTMHYLEGKPQKIVAEELGIHKTTVSRHITAALKKLKRLSMLA